MERIKIEAKLKLKKDLLKYNYYTHLRNKKEFIIRIPNRGSISENVSSIEVFQNSGWKKDNQITKSFMSKYVTGWITKEDILDTQIVNEALITGMSYRTIAARNLAFEKHKNQQYGSYPYNIHLTNVVSVLLHFGVNYEDDILIMSAWLHDILEDTALDKVLLSRCFGEEVRTIVELVSNQKDNTITKEENKKETFKRISTNQNAIIVKLADRISNVEFSLVYGNISKLRKYKKEQALIEKLIATKVCTDIGNKMYTYLDNIIGTIRL